MEGIVIQSAVNLTLTDCVEKHNCENWVKTLVKTSEQHWKNKKRIAA